MSRWLMPGSAGTGPAHIVVRRCPAREPNALAGRLQRVTAAFRPPLLSGVAAALMADVARHNVTRTLLAVLLIGRLCTTLPLVWGTLYRAGRPPGSKPEVQAASTGEPIGLPHAGGAWFQAGGGLRRCA
jgi:hypothetical protein